MTDSAPVTIAGALRHRRDDPRRLLICDTDRIGYAAAEQRSAALARGLIALGIGKGTHVGLLYPNGSAFVVAMLAATRIGAVAVPFSTFSTVAELRTQLRSSDVSILLAAPSYRSHDYRARLTEILGESPESDLHGPIFNTALPQLRWLCFDIDSLTRRGESISDTLLSALEDDVGGTDPMAIIYTSGSTSEPKGALHTHFGLLAHQRDLNKIRDLTSEDILFCNSPFFWIGGFAFALLATLLAGATLLCSNAEDPGATLDLLEAEKPTMANGFAAGIIHLARHSSFPDRDLSSIRRGNLYPIMAPDLRPADPELRHSMLGMTEAGSVITLCGDDRDQPESRRGSYGRPAPGFEVKVVADNGTEVPVGDAGEICIRGPYVMERYYGRGRGECFDADGWFHTGDMVRVDADGFVYFLGRAGAMIKTAGANVSPAEVENALGTALGSAAAAVHVIGIPDGDRGQLVAAVIAVDDQPDAGRFDESAIRFTLRNTLSAFKIPRRFAVVRLGDLPLLSSGKVNRSALGDLFDT